MIIFISINCVIWVIYWVIWVYLRCTFTMISILLEGWFNLQLELSWVRWPMEDRYPGQDPLLLFYWGSCALTGEGLHWFGLDWFGGGWFGMVRGPTRNWRPSRQSELLSSCVLALGPGTGEMGCHWTSHSSNAFLDYFGLNLSIDS